VSEKKMRINVEEVAVPSGSFVADLGMNDHQDAFRVAVDAKRFPDVDSFARAFAKNPPGWIAAAMRARDAVVGLFGLKKSSEALPTPNGGALEIGDFAGIFRVRDRTSNELLLGDDDRHLDFRVSILYTSIIQAQDDADSGEASVTVSTVVRFNNALGRAYFLPVRPVHRRIVPAMIRNAVSAIT
jgi:hypothetical protein